MAISQNYEFENKYSWNTFQVLISEAGGGDKTEKTDKVGGKKPPGSLKDGKGKKSSDTHVELDSRLLSALLMVGILIGSSEYMIHF